MQDGELYVWVGTQDQELTLNTAMALTKLPAAKIHIYTELLGGGFGRRAAVDFVKPAIEIARRVGYPVKVVFERADDIQSGYYRPASRARLEASLDAQGRIVAYRAKVVCSSVMASFNGELVQTKDGEYDFFATQGLARPAYDIPTREIRWVRDESGIPAWVWRGVGLSQNLFFLESFVDELAAAAKRDPVEFRLAHLPPESRARRVLELAAEKSAWGKPPAAGRARGVALQAWSDVFLALVADVSIANGQPKVHGVTFVIDCGRVINPDIVRAQMEGGVMMGLSAALSQAITFRDGAVVQSNFHDFPILRMANAPTIETFIIEGSDHVSGMGEFTTTTIAPAVANAIYALSGRRLRSLPLTLA
jgi:isoquinoline 1-oxidoreductase beta subunit